MRLVELCVVFLVTLIGVKCMKLRPEGKLLQELLDPNKYDGRSPPSLDSSATNVSVDMYIRSIQEVNDKDMSMKLTMTFRATWKDHRFVYEWPSHTNHSHYLQVLDRYPNIWRPDLFFSDEIDAVFHQFLEPNNMFRIYPDGTVLHSQRITLKLACPMNLRKFPKDTQTCSIHVVPYAHSTEYLELHWKEIDAFQINKHLEIPLFSYPKLVTGYCTSRTSTGTYSCLKVDLVFQRLQAAYMLRIYMPLLMLIILSYVAHFLPIKTHGNIRILVLLACLLMGSIMVAYFNENLGETKVPYARSVDYFTGIGLTLMFTMVIESLIMVTITSNEEEVQEIKIDHAKRNSAGVIRHIYETNKRNCDFWLRLIMPFFLVIYVATFF